MTAVLELRLTEAIEVLNHSKSSRKRPCRVARDSVHRNLVGPHLCEERTCTDRSPAVSQAPMRHCTCTGHPRAGRPSEKCMSSAIHMGSAIHMVSSQLVKWAPALGYKYFKSPVSGPQLHKPGDQPDVLAPVTSTPLATAGR